MPPTYCPCPRPILKRRTPSPEPEKPTLATSPRDESFQLLDIDPSVLTPLVHFAPHNDLTHTFLAYSPSMYDRSPIVVTPNKCSLPERGCPGKTYMPEDEFERSGAAMAFASRHRSGKKSRDQSPAGRHLHPRAVRVHLPRNEDDDEDDEPTPKPTPAALSHPLPPLIPDVSSSSSSDSDESDAFVSSSVDPMALAFARYAASLASSPNASPRTPCMSIPVPSTDMTAAFTTMYLSPKSSPSSPISFRSRIASYASRSSSPARSLSPTRASSRSHSPCRDSTSSARRLRKPKHARISSCPGAPASPSEIEGHYKAISERSVFTSCALDVPDDGCLGGF